MFLFEGICESSEREVCSLEEEYVVWLSENINISWLSYM